MPKFPWLTSFRTLDGIDCALIDTTASTSTSNNQSRSSSSSSPSSSYSWTDNIFRAKSNRLLGVVQPRRRRRNSRSTSNLIQFEYVLDHLAPSTLYSMELTARIFNMESFTSRPIRFTTTSKFDLKHYKFIFFIQTTNMFPMFPYFH